MFVTCRSDPSASESTKRLFPRTKATRFSSCVKRGRDGKQGPQGDKGLDGKPGRDGRDLRHADGY